MKKMTKLFVALLLMAVFMIPAAVAEAEENKVLEIPVNFTGCSWDDDWDTTSKSDIELYDVATPSAYSGDYKLEYVAYIPEGFMTEEGAAVNIGSGLCLFTGEEKTFAGVADCMSVELHSDGTLTTWNEEKQIDEVIDYATVEKKDGFFVVTYKGGMKNFVPEGEADITQASNVYMNLVLSFKGIFITAENSKVYVDNLVISKGDGTQLYNQNFEGSTSVEGEYRQAPGYEPKPLVLTTIGAQEETELTVEAKKLVIKAGKKAKIAATVSGDAKITYKTANKKIATVNAKGVVKAKKAGKTTITVEADGKTVKVKIVVKKNKK